MAKEQFIGTAALQTIANQIFPQVIMGPAYSSPALLEQLGINVITGVQFKNTKYVLNRKGGTTRRKVVGGTMNNTVGYLEERPLEAYLAWNKYMDNQDRYIETPIYKPGNAAAFRYPLSEVAMQATLMNYTEDLTQCLFFGDVDSTNPAMALYNGFHTLLAQDILSGRISVANKNLVKIGALDEPTTTNDFAAWTEVENFRKGWSTALKRNNVIVLCSSDAAIAIATAYSNKHGNNLEVDYLDNGNFKVKEWPKVTFAPSDDFGKGDRLIATLPGNLEYGVDSNSNQNHVIIKEGSDNDLLDLQIQVQSVQGCRVVNVNPNAFCMTDAAIEGEYWSGDYQKDTFAVAVNIEGAGTVTVDGTTPDNTKNYAANTTITLAATAAEGYEFVKWSDNNTSATRTVVTTGQPGALVAIFKKL